MARTDEITRAFLRWRDGEEPAREELATLLYDELRALARFQLREQAERATLQPTALVHEVYLKLHGAESSRWRDREHFLAVAATAMRQVLIDYARAKQADKRGGEWRRATLDSMLEFVAARDVDVEDLERALVKLSGLSARQARVVELRVFAGLTIEETARALGSGVTTVKSDWTFAQAWLKRELARSPS